MFARALIVSTALFVGSVSIAHADVASVLASCNGGGAACAAAIKVEIASLPATAVAGFLADLAEAAAANSALSTTVSASFDTLSSDPDVAAYSASLSGLSTGLATGQVSTAATTQTAAPAGSPTNGSDS